jgi:hypothetical protein
MEDRTKDRLGATHYMGMIKSFRELEFTGLVSRKPKRYSLLQSHFRGKKVFVDRSNPPFFTSILNLQSSILDS